MIKHFDYEVYDKLSLFKSLIETFLLKYNEKEYTVVEIIDKFKNNELTEDDINKVLTVGENKKVLGYLFLLEYNFESEMYDKNTNTLEYSALQLKNKNNNDKINRVFWHLLCKGKPEYTDLEQMVKLLKKDVLSLPDDKIIDGFNNFMTKMFKGEYKNETGNEVFFYMGIPGFHTLFQAMSIASNKEGDWIKFLDFYFKYKKIDTVDLELIRSLQYCNIISKKNYLLILYKFNELKVSGNMNEKECYWRFLLKYLEAMSSIGYINTHNVRSIINFKDKYTYKDIGFLKGILFNPLIDDLEKLKTIMPIEEPKIEIDEIIKFINKNMEIISTKIPIKEESPIKIDSKVYSKINNKEFERLNKLNCNRDDLKEEIKESYNNGLISAYEISQLDFVKKKGDN